MSLSLKKLEGRKMITVVFLIIVIFFVSAATVLAFKNDFSKEIEVMLYSVIGAIGVAGYFVVNTFFVNPSKEVSYDVSVPLVYERTMGIVTTPYQKHTGNRPEELAMFKGLDDLNTLRLYNAFSGMPQWTKLRSYSNTDNNDIIKLELLEFVFFQWLERHTNWLTVEERKSFSESGWGGGASMSQPNIKNSTEIELDKLEETNAFIGKYPLKITLPAGGKLKRKVKDRQIVLDITTKTGEFKIKFFIGLGGVFQHNNSSTLSNMLNSFINFNIGNIANPNVWMDYPHISVSYKPYRMSQFSEQTNRELAWMDKLEKHTFKDFSWDLLREYYATDFQTALTLYRSKYGDL